MKTIPGHRNTFKQIQDIGVIWVMEEADKLGFYNGNPEWSNLGQGEPETGEMQGAPPRINHIEIQPKDNRYGPLNGLEELRSAIAEHYNRLYRVGKSSQYSSANVSISMGGRLALTRIFTTLGYVRLGYKVPEYPAYEDMLNYHTGNIVPVCVPTKRENNYAIPVEEFSDAITDNQLGAFLMSNPCNPTGHVIRKDELAGHLRIARENECTLIVDEVYSHFIYEKDKPAAHPVSAAAFIERVNEDQVLIVDALTKSFRYPGWRLAWTIGPENIIEDLGRAASGIDGGPSLPVQRAAIQLFEPQRADQESTALRSVFSGKHNLMLRILRQCGMICSEDANSTFYAWADISQLPPPLNEAEEFFREALKHKVIVVPGPLFDIQPGGKRNEKNFAGFVRFSFGPEEENVRQGLDRITEMIQAIK